jgi:molecular chaperone Hsp33
MTTQTNMPETFLTALGLDRPETGDDAVVPFTLDQLDTRGRAVRLGAALDTIPWRACSAKPWCWLL